MATKKAATSPTVKVSKTVAQSIKQMQTDGRTVHVLGRVKGGKLEIDQASLAELIKKFPNANLSFVAVNAPFDPVRSAA
jgi:hypothetical protein